MRFVLIKSDDQLDFPFRSQGFLNADPHGALPFVICV
jgi:hypothetical protein